MSCHTCCHTSFYATQDKGDFLDCKHTFPAHSKFFIHQNPKDHFHRAVPNQYNLCWYCELPQSRFRIWHLVLLNFITFAWPTLQTGSLSPQKGMTFLLACQFPSRQSAWFYLDTEVIWTHSHYSTDEGIKQFWPQYRPKKDTTCYWIPLDHWAVHCNSLDMAIQSILIHLTVHLSRPHLSNLVSRMLGGSVSKTFQIG